jgi:DNA-nicking Smr family endonuclease
VAKGRRLAPEEAALWAKVIANVTPLVPVRAPTKPPEAPDAPPPAPRPPSMEGVGPIKKRRVAPAAPPPPPSTPGRDKAAATLDAGWDRRLARGLVQPESSIDLHGHSLDSAYHRLDEGLERALMRGDRVLLLVTGKPPRPESERPHARGAIRAAVGDWLAASRFSDRIAAVRGAHPRHGGSGALYIVLRRPRTAATRIF